MIRGTEAAAQDVRHAQNRAVRVICAALAPDGGVIVHRGDHDGDMGLI